MWLWIGAAVMSLSAISNCFGRKYKLDLESSKNFDEYMKAVGEFFLLEKFQFFVIFE